MKPNWSQFARATSGFVVLTGLLADLSGCTVMQERTETERTAVEQSLLSQAVVRGLSDLDVPLLPGTAVALEHYGFTDDKDFAHRLVESWFLDRGFRVVSGEDASPPVTVRLLIHALGTERGESFFGMPSVRSVLIPISLPELVIYRSAKQKGVARYHLELIESESGSLLFRSPTLEGTVFVDQFTVLFWFTFQESDVVPPPPAL